MGIAGTKAPNWGVAQWINLPQDKQAIDVADFKGKVVYLLCFQSWCPGCHARGFPTLLQLISSYDDTDDVAFVAVQTTFEGFAANSAQRAWETARRYKLDIPIGHDGSAQKRSTLMQRYRTGGTPWVIIIDKQGIVRRNGFQTRVNVELSISLHNVKTLVLTAHEDCGAGVTRDDLTRALALARGA
ncbi:MAG: peroxiredoxin family protein, partial [Phycisphaerales bacterium]